MRSIGANSKSIRRRRLKCAMGLESWFIPTGGRMKAIGAMIKDMAKDMRNSVTEIFL